MLNSFSTEIVKPGAAKKEKGQNENEISTSEREWELLEYLGFQIPLDKHKKIVCLFSCFFTWQRIEEVEHE